MRILILLFLALLLGGCATDVQHQAQAATDPTAAAEPVPSQHGELEATSRSVPPLSLTAQDGTGLALVALQAKAVVQGPLAFTELHLTFENPEERVLEGRFEITLPDQAAISRLAMKIEQQWQEAEVVEKRAAQRAYEDFLHRGQDPALLEKEAGNEFKARIFPIPARARKEIVISYSHQLEAADQPYRLPLAGLPKMEQLKVEVLLSEPDGQTLKPRRVTLEKQAFKPQGDFVLPQVSGVDGLVNHELVLVRVAPVVPSEQAESGKMLVLVDTSASRALGFTEQLARLEQLLKNSSSELRVACFDQSVEQIYNGPAKDFSAKLIQRRPLGASDLGAALVWAGKQEGFTRVLLMTDGIATLGDENLEASFKQLKAQRLDVLLAGGITERARMQQLVRGGLPQTGVILDLEMSDAELQRRLQSAAAPAIPVTVEGADWVWPQQLEGVQNGDSRLLYATVSKPGQQLTVQLAEQTIQVPLVSVPRPLLQRSAAVANIARLQALLDQGDESAKQQIIELSTEERVLSDHTALLVLETEDDYRRFNIDRKALTDILVVTEEGLEHRHRSQVYTAAKPVSVTKNKEDAKRKDKSSSVPETGLGDGGTEYVDQTVVTASQPQDNDGLRNSAAGEAGGGLPAGQARPQAPAARRAAASAPAREPVAVMEQEEEAAAGEDEPAVEKGAPALDGKLAELTQLRARDPKAALLQALKWREESPGDVLALVALGESFEANQDLAEAARAYGSIIDLFPSRADMRRFAGNRLEAIAAHKLALDTYQKAREQRPDHVASHRLLAYAQLRSGQYEAAFKTLEEGLSRGYPGGRFAGYQRILADDMGLVAAAWLAKESVRKGEILARLKKSGATLASESSLRFVLTWETDANDVDFHIHDGRGGHAYYSSMHLPSGGDLYADVTTGYGPECFAIRGQAQAFPYRLRLHYYSRGPMGYGMGKVEVVSHDGKGGLKFEQRPFVVMNDQAYVELGSLKSLPR